jgi:hypothetical protein
MIAARNFDVANLDDGELAHEVGLLEMLLSHERESLCEFIGQRLSDTAQEMRRRQSARYTFGSDSSVRVNDR